LKSISEPGMKIPPEGGTTSAGGRMPRFDICDHSGP
jgi:hypothetical protein